MRATLIFILVFLASCSSSGYKQFARQVPSSAEETCPLKVGSEVPNVKIRDMKEKSVSLHKLLKGKKSVLVFYRGGWCPYCNLQLQGLRKVLNDFKREGIQVLAISPDKPSKLSESSSKHKLNYTLYSDSQAQAITAFGLGFRVSDEIHKKYLGYGINLDDSSGESHHILPVPAVYLVGSDLVVRYFYANPNYKDRMDEKVLLYSARTLLK